MKVSMQIDTKQLNSYIERTIVRVRRTATKFVEAEAKQILAESLEEVPRDTGTLAGSAFIQQEQDGSFTIGYGQGDSLNPKTHSSADNYMLKIHEDLSLNHPNGGKAKFLEDPVNRHRAVMEAKAAKVLRQSMEE